MAGRIGLQGDREGGKTSCALRAVLIDGGEVGCQPHCVHLVGFIRDISLPALPLPRLPQHSQQQQKPGVDSQPSAKRQRLAPTESQSLTAVASAATAAPAVVPAVHRGREGVLAGDSDDDEEGAALAAGLAGQIAPGSADLMASDTMAALRLLHAEVTFQRQRLSFPTTLLRPLATSCRSAGSCSVVYRWRGGDALKDAGKPPLACRPDRFIWFVSALSRVPLLIFANAHTTSGAVTT